MRKVVLGVESESELTSLAERLKSASIDHKVWIEQPENISTCIAVKPYLKDDVHKYVKHLKLMK